MSALLLRYSRVGHDRSHVAPNSHQPPATREQRDGKSLLRNILRVRRRFQRFVKLDACLCVCLVCVCVLYLRVDTAPAFIYLSKCADSHQPKQLLPYLAGKSSLAGFFSFFPPLSCLVSRAYCGVVSLLFVPRKTLERDVVILVIIIGFPPVQTRGGDVARSRVASEDGGIPQVKLVPH